MYSPPTVATDWIQIGTERMFQARRKRGLSYDEAGYRVGQNGHRRVIGRTYGRWEKEGRVPREALPAVAAVLGLDAGQLLADQPTRVQWQQVSEVLSEVAVAMQALVSLLAEQREVVERLETVAAALQQREAASSSS